MGERDALVKEGAIVQIELGVEREGMPRDVARLDRGFKGGHLRT